MALPALLSPVYTSVCISPTPTATLHFAIRDGDGASSPWYESVFTYEEKKGMFVVDVFVSLFPQDGWEALVSGLVAFLRLWHQHSQLHCLSKYIKSLHVILRILY